VNGARPFAPPFTKLKVQSWLKDPAQNGRLAGPFQQQEGGVSGDTGLTTGNRTVRSQALLRG
jgi:hypothetical protein